MVDYASDRDNQPERVKQVQTHGQKLLSECRRLGLIEPVASYLGMADRWEEAALSVRSKDIQRIIELEEENEKLKRDIIAHVTDPVRTKAK